MKQKQNETFKNQSKSLKGSTSEEILYSPEEESLEKYQKSLPIQNQALVL